MVDWVKRQNGPKHTRSKKEGGWTSKRKEVRDSLAGKSEKISKKLIRRDPNGFSGSWLYEPGSKKPASTPHIDVGVYNQKWRFVVRSC